MLHCKAILTTCQLIWALINAIIDVLYSNKKKGGGTKMTQTERIETGVKAVLAVWTLAATFWLGMEVESRDHTCTQASVAAANQKAQAKIEARDMKLAKEIEMREQAVEKLRSKMANGKMFGGLRDAMAIDSITH